VKGFEKMMVGSVSADMRMSHLRAIGEAAAIQSMSHLGMGSDAARGISPNMEQTWESEPKPRFGASHIGAMLTTPVTVTINGVSYTMPECFAGKTCIANIWPIGNTTPETGGHILAQAMTPEELAAFYEAGVIPQNQQLCFLCASAEMLSMYLRALLLGHSSKFIDYQWFGNLCNCEDGYYKEMMIVPSTGGSIYSGFTCPVFKASLSKMWWDRDQRTGVWKINQSALVWKPPPVGRSSAEVAARDQADRHFRSGAAALEV